MTARETGTPASNLPTCVLLVEDNPIIAMNTEALLEELGVPRIFTAGSVAEALALIREQPFDLGILDLQLGEGEDSLPVAEHLHALGVPLVFATGLGEDIPFSEAIDGRPLLKKPYGFEELARIIGQ